MIKLAYSFSAPPLIDGSRNDAQPRVIIGRSVTLWCMVSGHPAPTLKWHKDGDELTRTELEQLNFIDENQGLQIVDAKPKHNGRWTCVAENEAGTAELDISLDVWGN
jgi:hemicentin